MKYTDQELQEIKAFIEENLNQDIDVRLIPSMSWNPVLGNFFNYNLTPYITPDTSNLVRNFICDLKS